MEPAPLSPVIGFFERNRAALAVVYLIVIPIILLASALWQAHDSRDLKQKVERQAAQGAAALDLICKLQAVQKDTQSEDRADLAGRRAFLADHPEGFAGIPAAVIRRSIDDKQATLDNRQKTIDALASGRCDTKGAP